MIVVIVVVVMVVVVDGMETGEKRWGGGSASPLSP